MEKDFIQQIVDHDQDFANTMEQVYGPNWREEVPLSKIRQIAGHIVNKGFIGRPTFPAFQ